MKTNLRVRGLVASATTLSLLILCLLAARNPAQTAPALPTADPESAPVLKLDILDKDGRPLAARFSLNVDGKIFQPKTLNEHGLRFVSVHESKKQVYPVTYARGTGTVEFKLPSGAKLVEVHAARGFEFLPVSESANVNPADSTELKIKIKMRRWASLEEQGWLAADAHVHYDRLSKDENADWLTMLEADGLSHAFFMILKGGKVPGLWAQQYAYGEKGEATDGRGRLVSGEEYRDSSMGHINLLGLSEVIQPISTGGLGEPKVLVNWPPLLDVMKRSRELGGLSGVAHGGSLGRHPTATADTVLGAVDFFEIGNAHLYAVDLWYRLLNCGYNLPPAAGTDLPNFPFRDPWQPFLGSMRMYVKTDGRNDFDSWKKAVKRGEVFVTSGPLLKFTVNGQPAGSVIRLPAGNCQVLVEAEMSSPQPLRKFEVVQSGEVADVYVHEVDEGPIYQKEIHESIRVKKSCWLAVRGRGNPIRSLKASIQRKAPWIETDVVAHSGIIRVIVGDEPIRSKPDTEALVQLLRTQQEFYRTSGRYTEAADRLKMVDLFEQAVRQLESR